MNLDYVLSFEQDMSFVASVAAVELEDLSAGREGKARAVSRLVKLLSNESSTNDPQASPLSLQDATVTVVMNSAIRDSRIRTLNTRDELHSEVAQIRERLRKASEASDQSAAPDRSDLEQLRDFCLALSKYARLHDLTFREERERYPFEM